MLNQDLKNEVFSRILPRVRTPAQYVGGELNSIVKDHKTARGTVCLAFPDTYSLGMSHHGLQVLYSLMNEAGWACERAFTPLPDFESALKEAGLPLYSLETFTPLCRFDVLGFSLQYEICYTNVLTMLDLGGIALHAEDRGPDDTLVIAGGPGARIRSCSRRSSTCSSSATASRACRSSASCGSRCRARACRARRSWQRIAGSVEWAYVPRFYEPIYAEDGTIVEIRRTRDDVPEAIKPCVIRDLDAIPLPTRPVVPFVETAHDRIAIEIMRGCPWQCRFCQSTVIKRPLRHRTVETIVTAALESYRSTGYDEISLLSLSTSDYPDFEELVTRMSEVFTPLGVKISLPSLRITETLKKIPALLSEGRRSGLTLAPEVARDDMREQIRKPINNQDLYDGCAEAFRRGWRKVKLYFMCGLPGERPADLDGIVDDGRDDRPDRQGCDRPVRRRDGQRVELHPQAAHAVSVERLAVSRVFPLGTSLSRSRKCKVRSVTVKCHDIERSMLEGILTRGDRRVAAALEAAWSRGARLDAWGEYFNPRLWWETFADLGIDVPFYSHRERPIEEVLPWDHIHIRFGREYLAKEQIALVRAARGDGGGGVGVDEITFRS